MTIPRGRMVSDQRFANDIALKLFENLETWASRSAAAFRNIFLEGKVRCVNPLLCVETEEDCEYLFHLVRDTILEGRMIDFGHLPNEVIKTTSLANRAGFEAGEFLHPYESWVGVHRWEGGFSAYWFGPKPGVFADAGDATCAVEMYGLDLPSTPDMDGAVVIYDIVAFRTKDSETRCFAFPMRNEGIFIPEGGRIANSLDPLVCMLALLHDGSVPVTHQLAPVKLNKQRAKNGRAAIPAHTIVHTMDYITTWRAGKAARKAAQGGHHASPVAHTRRAHERLLASGRVVPVRSSKVNWRNHEEMRRMFYKVIL